MITRAMTLGVTRSSHSCLIQFSLRSYKDGGMSSPLTQETRRRRGDGEIDGLGVKNSELKRWPLYRRTGLSLRKLK